jgi:hypothetical protein
MCSELPVSARGLCGQGVELCGRREPLRSLFSHPLPFLEHMHELDTGQRALGRLKGLEAEHRPSHPLYRSVILFQNIIEILNPANHDRGAVLGIIAPNGGGIGLTAVDGDRLRDPMAADRFREKGFPVVIGKFLALRNHALRDMERLGYRVTLEPVAAA